MRTSFQTVNWSRTSAHRLKLMLRVVWDAASAPKLLPADPSPSPMAGLLMIRPRVLRSLRQCVSVRGYFIWKRGLILLAKLCRQEVITPKDRLLTFYCPDIARKARPGQSVEVRVTEGTDPYLRRPISIFDAQGDEFSLRCPGYRPGTQDIAIGVSDTKRISSGRSATAFRLFPRIGRFYWPVVASVSPRCISGREIGASRY